MSFTSNQKEYTLEEKVHFNIKVQTKYEKAMDIIEDIVNASGKNIPNDEKIKLMKTFRTRTALKTLIT